MVNTNQLLSCGPRFALAPYHIRQFLRYSFTYDLQRPCNTLHMVGTSSIGFWNNTWLWMVRKVFAYIASIIASIQEWTGLLLSSCNSYNVGPPSDVRWFITPMNTIVIGTINHSEIGVICTNLAIVWGPHFVDRWFSQPYFPLKMGVGRLVSTKNWSFSGSMLICHRVNPIHIPWIYSFKSHELPIFPHVPLASPRWGLVGPFAGDGPKFKKFFQQLIESMEGWTRGSYYYSY